VQRDEGDVRIEDKMMLRIVAGWLAVAALVRAQTPEKAVDAYLRAMGGAQAVGQIQDLTIAGSLTEDTTGKTGSFSLITKAPNRFYLEILAGTDRTVEAYNGMSTWTQDAEGTHTLTGASVREAEASGRYWNSRLQDLKKAKIGLQAAGSEKVRGRDAVHVKVLLGTGLTRDVYFDSETHLLVRETGTSGQFDYDEYRAVKGVQVPYRIELHRGGHIYKVSVTRAEINSSVDAAVFDFPRTASTPVPDVKALIMEVQKNQKAIEELMKEYTCHLTSQEDKTDSKGQVTSKTVKEFEVFYVAGEEVRRLVAKDGKPLSADEKKKEDERFNKEFAKLQKRAAEIAADPKKQKKDEDKQDAQLSDFLRALKFTNARHERFRGQDVIAVDFGPNPEYKPKKTIENIIQKVAGVVWIDEKAKDVARLEAHFSDSAKVGAGILGSVEKGSNFVFEQARINEEVWLPSYVEVHVAGRLLVVKLKANAIDRYTDYKKFRAESTIKIVQ
jgi:hypothetical protein